MCWSAQPEFVYVLSMDHDCVQNELKTEQVITSEGLSREGQYLEILVPVLLVIQNR